MDWLRRSPLRQSLLVWLLVAVAAVVFIRDVRLVVFFVGAFILVDALRMALQRRSRQRQ